MRAFYIKYILHPLFMVMVRCVPLFLDYAYIYVGKLQHAVHGKLLQPDYIEQVREALSEKGE